ncbi:S8 family peptidase [Nannocystis pusilla]|uniref:S8 family peptidase n=1 Tax=Nannocystis pusilla TaxID=889268 RepID=UPI003BF2DF39
MNRKLWKYLVSPLVLVACEDPQDELLNGSEDGDPVETSLTEDAEQTNDASDDSGDTGDAPAMDVDDPPPLTAERAALPEFVPFEAIVKFRSSAATPAQVALSARAQVEELAPDTHLVRFDAARSAGDPIAATWARIDELRASGAVEYAHPNWLFRLSLTPSDERYAQQWHYPQINLPAAWDLTTGSPTVRIAILDTGRTSHPDLAGKWVPGVEYDAFGEDGDASSDGTWKHAVAVASIAGGSTNNPTNPKYSAGVCWNCQLLNVKISNGNGPDLAAVIRGIRWAVDNGARVLNMSFETDLPCSSPAQPNRDIPGLKAAVEYAASRNVTVVAAAGNMGRDAKDTSPASCPGVIAVAATDSNKALAAYSNYGQVTLAAPGGAGSLVTVLKNGVEVPTIGPDAYGQGFSCGSDPYSGFTQWTHGVVANWTTNAGVHCDRYLSGTSLAAPHVAGVVGLMLSRNPNLTPAKIRQILQSTALPACNGKCGAGLLNAFSAVQQAAPVVMNDPKPLANFTVQCAGLQCTFNGNGSTDNSGIVAYEWILPGEQFRTGAVVSAFMPGYGLKAARLRVTDTSGQSTLIQKNFTISQPNVYPTIGQYHNQERPDNRVSVSATHDDALVVTWFTFDPSGKPVWYTSGAGHRTGARWTQPLYKSTWLNGQWAATEVGRVWLDFSSSSVAWFSWQLNGVSGGERLTYRFGGDGRSGAWFMPTESGWGFQVEESSAKLEAAVTFYDKQGTPLWMRSEQIGAGSNLTIPLKYYSGKGLCPGCLGKQPATPVNGWAGSTTLKIANGESATGAASINIQYMLSDVWKRPLQTIQLATKP